MSVLRQINEVLSENLKDRLAEDAGYRRVKPEPMRGPARPLLDNDIASFMEAAESRPLYDEAPPRRARPQSTRPRRERFWRDLTVMYPFRMKRIERDLKWLRKQAPKHGIDPEDVKWFV